MGKEGRHRPELEKTRLADYGEELEFCLYPELVVTAVSAEVT